MGFRGGLLASSAFRSPVIDEVPCATCSSTAPPASDGHSPVGQHLETIGPIEATVGRAGRTKNGAARYPEYMRRDTVRFLEVHHLAVSVALTATHQTSHRMLWIAHAVEPRTHAVGR
jgi:hypothetical protein